jgi:tetratricopeptide (TPR) repeat protein
MTVRSGEGTAPVEARAIFEEGLVCYRRGDAVEAHGLFERAHRRAPGDARIMSWYGLTLVLVERNSNLGILYCDQALRAAGPEPEIVINKARAHMGLGQRDHAIKAVSRGLEAHPLDAALQLAQACLGWRRSPVLPFLGRENPINAFLGRVRHRFSRRPHPAPDWNSMTLGLLPEDEPAGDRSNE